jgi:hypothetical protein
MKVKILLFLLGLPLLFQNVSGQKKLTVDDVFIDEAETLLSPLPEIWEWIDHRHYLEVREDKILKVRAESGKSVELMIYPDERHGYKLAMGIADNRAALAFWLRHFLGREISE